MTLAAAHGQAVVAAGFRRLWFTIGAVFVLLVIYRLISPYLARRDRSVVLVRAEALPDRSTATAGNGRPAGTE
jgi:hypothetical protein